MDFVWLDYDPQTMGYIENWLDESAVRSTGLDEGFRNFYEYWANEDGFVVGKNYWSKVVFKNAEPFAVIAFCLYEQKTTIMEIVIAPEKRGQGMGSALLKELLECKEITGFTIQKSKAVIYPNNTASQKAFENAGFQYHHTHEDGSATYYIYERGVSMFEFYYLEKDRFAEFANGLFSILYNNMSKIAPTGNNYEEDFQFWFQAMQKELQNGNRSIIVILQKEPHEIVGYFQYSVNARMFMMEEIQISPLHQSRHNIFRGLYGFVFDRLGTAVDHVEAYANKDNTKSIGILNKLGLSVIGENKTGTSYHFRGTYADLLNWYNSKAN